MYCVFMDESGDLGFDFSKKGTTKYFVVALVLTKDVRKFQKVVRDTKSKMLKKKYKKNA